MAIEAGAGLLESDPTPVVDGFDEVIHGLRIRSNPTHKVIVEAGDGDGLTISGDRESRSLFATNLRKLADGQLSDHIHVEYFPTHFVLAPTSAPLIVVLASAQSG